MLIMKQDTRYSFHSSLVLSAYPGNVVILNKNLIIFRYNDFYRHEWMIFLSYKDLDEVLSFDDVVLIDVNLFPSSFT